MEENCSNGSDWAACWADWADWLGFGWATQCRAHSSNAAVRCSLSSVAHEPPRAAATRTNGGEAGLGGRLAVARALELAVTARDAGGRPLWPSERLSSRWGDRLVQRRRAVRCSGYVCSVRRTPSSPQKSHKHRRLTLAPSTLSIVLLLATQARVQNRRDGRRRRGKVGLDGAIHAPDLCAVVSPGLRLAVFSTLFAYERSFWRKRLSIDVLLLAATILPSRTATGGT